MKEKNIILTARVMSIVFTPFYLPILGLIALDVYKRQTTNEIGFSYRCSKPETSTVVSGNISHIPIKLCQSGFDILDTKSLHERQHRSLVVLGKVFQLGTFHQFWILPNLKIQAFFIPVHIHVDGNLYGWHPCLLCFLL